jgi:hypothetical protein
MIHDETNVLKRIVTGDESWSFMYDPETKRQSAASFSPKKQKAQSENAIIAGENNFDCIF